MTSEQEQWGPCKDRTFFLQLDVCTPNLSHAPHSHSCATSDHGEDSLANLPGEKYDLWAAMSEIKTSNRYATPPESTWLKNPSNHVALAAHVKSAPRRIALDMDHTSSKNGSADLAKKTLQSAMTS